LALAFAPATELARSHDFLLIKRGLTLYRTFFVREAFWAADIELLPLKHTYLNGKFMSNSAIQFASINSGD